VKSLCRRVATNVTSEVCALPRDSQHQPPPSTGWCIPRSLFETSPYFIASREPNPSANCSRCSHCSRRSRQSFTFHLPIDQLIFNGKEMILVLTVLRNMESIPYSARNSFWRLELLYFSNWIQSRHDKLAACNTISTVLPFFLAPLDVVV